MDVYFLTRDVMADYPRVNWIPSLPGETEAFLSKLSSPPLRCHNIETPELIIKQNGKNWSIFASAIDSGRVDFSGTPILITLYITGKSGVDAPPVWLVDHYINEYLEKTDKLSFLARYFSNEIADGDPEKWSNLTQEEKTTVANSLLKSSADTEENAKFSFPVTPFWCGHQKKEDFSYFRQFCSLLLEGGANGSAFSFTSLQEKKIKDFLRVIGTAENIAILFLGENCETESSNPAVNSNDEWGDVQIKKPSTKEWVKCLLKTGKIKKNFKKIIFPVILIGILSLLYIVVRLWS